MFVFPNASYTKLKIAYKLQNKIKNIMEMLAIGKCLKIIKLNVYLDSSAIQLAAVLGSSCIVIWQTLHDCIIENAFLVLPCDRRQYYEIIFSHVNPV